MNEKCFISFFIKIVFFHICYNHNVLSLKIQTTMQNQLRTQNTLKVESMSRAKFVDALLLDVLQMLMSSKKDKDANRKDMPTYVTPQEVLPTTENKISEPVVETEPEVESESVNNSENDKLSGNSVSSADIERNKLLEEINSKSMISSSLNSQKKEIELLNKQIKELSNELAEWKNIDHSGSSSSNSENQHTKGKNEITLTLRYPGMAVNESSKTADNLLKEQKENQNGKLVTQNEGTNGIQVIDPTTMRVPVFVIAPISASNYEVVSKQLSPNRKTKYKVAEMVSIKNIPGTLKENKKVYEKEYKEAMAHSAFFTNDMNISELRLDPSNTSINS